MAKKKQKDNDLYSKGITKITVEGFKSIKDEQSIEIRPLTILAGANSSGKSAIMQPILLMKQTLEATYTPGGALKIDGPNVSFNKAEQLLSKTDDKTTVKQFSIEIEHFGEFSNKYYYFPLESGQYEIDKFVQRDENGTRIFSMDMKHEEIYEQILDKFEKMIDKTEKLEVVRYGCFLRIESNTIGEDGKKEHGLSLGFSSSLARDINGLIHLSGLRDNPERSYLRTAVGQIFRGVFENYIASIILDWQKWGDNRLEELKHNLSILGINWTVKARRLLDTEIELFVSRHIHKKGRTEPDYVSIADVGIGVSQLLPVLVALLVAEPGQLVYLEQPEIHLHPNAQLKLAEVLADATKRGVRVIVETHSSLLLLGIQTLVAREDYEFDGSQVALNWFTQNEETGYTEVSSETLDEAGTFSDWPVDFGSVMLYAQKEFIKATSERKRKR